MKTTEEARAALEALTPKQRQVALMLAQGLNTAQIADLMCVTEGTIKDHRYAAYKALGIKKSVQLGVIVGMSGMALEMGVAA